MRARTTFGCLLLLVVGCQGGSAPTTPQPGLVRSDKQRVTNPNVPPADLTALVSGNTEAALALYGQLRGTSGNLFFSPHSISTALAMTYAGARSSTESEMATALHFTLPQERLHPAFNALDLALEGRGQGAQGASGGGFRLRVDNSLWGQTGYDLAATFLDTLAENYDAGLGLLDFRANPESARLTINKWVSDRTEGRIPDLLQPGSVSPATRLVLTNTIYFNAAWKNPFDEDHTAPAPFHLAGGTEVSVPTMSEEIPLRSGEKDGVRVVELDYDGEEIAMTLFVPPAGQLDAFEAGLTPARLGELLATLQAGRAIVYLPKFTFRSRFGLKEALAALGMPEAFSDAADLSGITGRKELFIQDVVHEAFILLGENGTEAAAATGVVVGVTSVPPEIRVDRPFVFVIRDRPTGAVLFLGRVVDPRG